MIRFSAIAAMSEMIISVWCSDSTVKIAPSFVFRKPFDRIPQHGSRHFLAMLLQELLLNRKRTLPDFAKHPTHGLVDQVVVVSDEHPGNFERIREMVLLDIMKGSHD